MNNKKRIQEFIGLEGFNKYGINTRKGIYSFLKVTPVNVSVLSYIQMENKIEQLKYIISSVANIEISCIDAHENFESNINYLLNRIENEKNEKIVELLNKDISFLENMQEQIASSRVFMFVLKFKRSETDEQIFSNIIRSRKIIEENNLEVKLMEKDELKRMLALYFSGIDRGENIDDTDGLKYL